MCPFVGLSHLVQRGFGDAADALATERVEHIDARLSTRADALAQDAHGVESMLLNEVGH
jgi:hypothetical protein